MWGVEVGRVAMPWVVGMRRVSVSSVGVGSVDMRCVEVDMIVMNGIAMRDV